MEALFGPAQVLVEPRTLLYNIPRVHVAWVVGGQNFRRRSSGEHLVGVKGHWFGTGVEGIEGFAGWVSWSLSIDVGTAYLVRLRQTRSLSVQKERIEF